MPLKERRQYSRAKVEWPVSISTAQERTEGEIKNISLGGALIHLRILPNMEDPLDLSVEIPEQDYAIFTTAEAVRFDVYDSGNTTVSYGLGVRLKNISEDDLRFLTTTVLR